MLTNQRDELVCRYQECDCVDKPEQSQNDKPSQPIGISQREKPCGQISQFMRPHGKKRRTPNTQRPTPNKLKMPGGDSNSRPTPKAFGADLLLQMVNCQSGIFLSL
jgi:hypothetical protein